MRCMLFSDLRCREVICLEDGRRLGYISDFEIDVSCGKVLALILPGQRGLKGLFAGGGYRVPYCEIASIGADLILVNRCEQLCPERSKVKK